MHSFKHYGAVIGLLAGVFSTVLASASSEKPAGAPDPLELLRKGNERFVSGESIRPHQNARRREALASGQKPFAIVLTCADSRVAPEIFFDQGLGDIFVLRNAGNVVDDHVLGSMEYAVEHLGTSLVVVVGHSKCGAVAAAVAGGEAPGHIGSIVESIAPSVSAGVGAADPVDAVVRANARRMAELIAGSKPILAKAVGEGHLKVVAARYDIATGQVEFLKSAARDQ